MVDNDFLLAVLGSPINPGQMRHDERSQLRFVTADDVFGTSFRFIPVSIQLQVALTITPKIMLATINLHISQVKFDEIDWKRRFRMLTL
jgi:hypothetical protein